MKICIKCKEQKPLENFNKGVSQCKCCVREYNKQYNQLNKEIISKQIKGYNLSNKQKISEKSKEYYELNKERICLKVKGYYEDNKEKVLNYIKEYNVVNKEKIAAYKKKYRELNREKLNKQDRDYREKNKKQIVNSEFVKKEKTPRIIDKVKISISNKKYREKNKEKIAKVSRQYREKNKEKIQERTKEYVKLNKEKINKYIKTRRKEDPIFKFSCTTRRLIYNSFKRNANTFTKNHSTEDILGCNIEYFREYISLKFTKGMSLNNHGEWHLDHIIPLATAKTEEEIIRLNHYTNFQPLWAKDNLIKGDKIIEQQLVLI